MAGAHTALQMVKHATPVRRFRVAGDRGKRIDGAALARRRREHRRGYQHRNRGDRHHEWIGTVVCIAMILLIGVVVAAAFDGRSWW